MKKNKFFFGVLIFTMLLTNTTIIAQNRNNQQGTGETVTDTVTTRTETLNNRGEDRRNYGQWGLLGLLGLLGLMGSGKRRTSTTTLRNP